MAKEEGAPPKYVKNSDGKFELNSEYKDWKEKKDLPVADATPVVAAAEGGSALTSSLTGGFLNSSLNESGATKEFHLKQKFNLLADNFTIKSVPGDKKAYVVKGDKFKWGNQCSFQLLDGTQIAYIKETKKSVISLAKTYEIYKGETVDGNDSKPWAMVRQQDWNIIGRKKTVYIDVPDSGDNATIVITGDGMAWNFEMALVREDVTAVGDNTTSTTTVESKIGDVDKKWGLIDNYGVRVAPNADEVEVLICAIIIDQIFHSNEEQR